MGVRRLGQGASAAAVLLGLHSRARRLGCPPPAALAGQWFESAAILAPTLDVQPCDDLPDVGSLPGPPGAVGGGWFGYLSYPDGHGALPRVAGGWTDSVLRLDTAGCWWFESLRSQLCPADLLDVVRTGGPCTPWEVAWVAPDPQAHRRAVLDCSAAIADGEVYQACICSRFTGALRGSAVGLFASGIQRSAPARAGYLSGHWGAVASFSPELFLGRRGRMVRSSPIKGTLPIGDNPARLRSSAKDVAENVMIVDLVRNDLGRVCEPGSITVAELLAVRPAPAVWHLVSTVQGELRPEVDDRRLIEAMFPPGSVTGTPKLRARQLLSSWETQARGVYCGAIGLVSPWAGLELNVAIRTVEVDPAGTVALGVGGGITIDSDPDVEWQECLDKAGAVTNLRFDHVLAASTSS